MMFIRVPNMAPRLAAEPPLRVRGSSARTSASQPTRPSAGAVMKGLYGSDPAASTNGCCRRIVLKNSVRALQLQLIENNVIQIKANRIPLL
jgi:hypothetical protein